VLLLTRSERTADRKLAERFDLPHVEHREVPASQASERARRLAVVPTEGLAAVAGWLDEVMPRGGTTIVTPSRSGITVRIPSHRPISGTVLGGGTAFIRERVSVGPGGLFGIETEGTRMGPALSAYS